MSNENENQLITGRHYDGQRNVKLADDVAFHTGKWRYTDLKGNVLPDVHLDEDGVMQQGKAPEAKADAPARTKGKK